MMDKSKKSWEKRLAGQPDPLTVDFVQSLSYDKRLYKYDIVGSIAHAQMLAEQKLITRADLKAIKDGLIKYPVKSQKDDSNSTRRVRIFIWRSRRHW
jgi:argininosuccinate lyase